MRTISTSPRRSEIRAFALLCTIAVTAAAAIAWPAEPLRIGAIGGTALILVAFGWRWNGPLEAALVAWRAADRRVTRVSSAVLAAASYLVVQAAGARGSKLQWRPPSNGASGWLRHRTVTADAFASTSHVRSARPGRSWVQPLIAWGRAPGNGWTLALLPYLIALQLIGARGERSLGKDIYTLY